MYLAVDVGGSKTLLASFAADGQIKKQHKFPTPKKYQDFLKEFGRALGNEYEGDDFLAVCCAMPGLVDRQKGVVRRFGNLAWEDVPVKRDLEKLFARATVYIENDANLGGLSEALDAKKEYQRVLYLTVSTGIGDGVIISGKIDSSFADSEAGHMLINHGGRIQRWEDFASGRALANRAGKLAKDIDSPKIWHQFAKDLAAGIYELLPVIRPEVVIIGGSVGVHFAKFGSYLNEELGKYPAKLYDIPPVIKAKRPTEAVIYGCYEFIRQNQ